MKRYFLLFCLVVSGQCPAAEGTTTKVCENHLPVYRAARVIDGDTFVATDGNVKFKVRIAGLDALEISQTLGDSSKALLSDLLSQNDLKIEPVGQGLDLYGRVLAHVSANGKDVAIKLISQGLATYYRPKCQAYPNDRRLYNYDPAEYVAAESTAAEKHLGLWKNQKPTLPCEYRRAKKAKEE